MLASTGIDVLKSTTFLRIYDEFPIAHTVSITQNGYKRLQSLGNTSYVENNVFMLYS